jgi:hypothetical protein
VRIKGTCRRCGRDFLVSQVLESGGVCPWDGKPFQPDYAAVLVEALRDAENAGSTLENALEKVADLEPEFVLHADTVIDRMREHLERLERTHGEHRT